MIDLKSSRYVGYLKLLSTELSDFLLLYGFNDVKFWFHWMQYFPIEFGSACICSVPFCLFVMIFTLVMDFAVTATKNAQTALNLLRGNKSGFDLVISDVQMPDMDGFKLLELVGLEMDLPVISKKP